MKLGFIGAGEMGGAIIRGLLAQGLPKEDFIASVHTPESAERIQKELGIDAVTDNRRVIMEAGWLFVAVKPAQVESVLSEIAASGVPAKPLICMALGWTVEKIQRVLPAWPVIRIMPNTPLAVGEGVTLFHFAAETPKRTRREVMGLFDGMGKTFEISLSVFDAATALSGSGPAFVYYFIDSLASAAADKGLPQEDAVKLAVQTVIGAAKMVERENLPPAELVQKVATPGGCTAAGMDVLAASDVKKVVAKTLGATEKKAAEYSN
ncbi:MAG: pyrroline-5-carboxylate reductase [Elusimicrobiaceae bacterium]|nr:pyrroline-5-carboxylate reductase [Elusimicrobiaceae bacterium]